MARVRNTSKIGKEAEKDSVLLRSAEEHVASKLRFERLLARPFSLKEMMAARAVAGRKTPVEVMLDAMDAAYDAAQDVETDTLGRLTNLNQAVSVAKDVAPYIHSKLSAITVSGDDEKPPIKVELSAAEELKSMVRGK